MVIPAYLSILLLPFGRFGPRLLLVHITVACNHILLQRVGKSPLTMGKLTTSTGPRSITAIAMSIITRGYYQWIGSRGNLHGFHSFYHEISGFPEASPPRGSTTKPLPTITATVAPWQDSENHCCLQQPLVMTTIATENSDEHIIYTTAWTTLP